MYIQLSALTEGLFTCKAHQMCCYCSCWLAVRFEYKIARIEVNGRKYAFAERKKLLVLNFGFMKTTKLNLEKNQATLGMGYIFMI